MTTKRTGSQLSRNSLPILDPAILHAKQFEVRRFLRFFQA